MPQLAEKSRIREIEQSGKKILIVNFDDLGNEEVANLRERFLEFLKASEDGSVRVLFRARHLSYRSSEGKAWKAQLPLLNQKICKSAVIGLTPLGSMVMMGVRAYARLMGIEKKSIQARPFGSEEESLAYLSQD